MAHSWEMAGGWRTPVRLGSAAASAGVARRHPGLESLYLLHAVKGELHWRMKEHDAAAASFRRALSLAQVGPEQIYLARLLERTASEGGF